MIRNLIILGLLIILAISHVINKFINVLATTYRIDLYSPIKIQTIKETLKEQLK